jgi:hypothetical protein
MRNAGRFVRLILTRGMFGKKANQISLNDRADYIVPVIG